MAKIKTVFSNPEPLLTLMYPELIHIVFFFFFFYPELIHISVGTQKGREVVVDLPLQLRTAFPLLGLPGSVFHADGVMVERPLSFLKRSVVQTYLFSLFMSVQPGFEAHCLSPEEIPLFV